MSSKTCNRCGDKFTWNAVYDSKGKPICEKCFNKPEDSKKNLEE